MRLVMLQFETALQECIRMGITIFKILIWGGMSSDIRAEIMFTIKLSFKPHILKGAQWLSGRVVDSRKRGRGFEPH